jgi:hypothetical protein
MRQPAPDMAHKAEGEGDQLFRDAALVHDLTRDHEQERGHQQVVVGPAKGDQPDDHGHHRRVQQDHRHRRDAQHIGDGNAHRQQHDEQDQNDVAGRENISRPPLAAGLQGDPAHDQSDQPHRADQRDQRPAHRHGTTKQAPADRPKSASAPKS